MKLKMIIIFLGILFSTSVSAQNQLSLLDTDKIKDHLALDQKQFKTINAKIERIKEIIEEDEKIISQIKARVKNGDEPGFFEKIGVKRGHDSRDSQIEDLVDEIEDELTDEQRIKFNEIEKPKLKALKKEDVFGK